MFGEGLGRTRAPRHLAGPAPRHLVADGPRPAQPVATEPLEPTEVPPLARVHRSRFAFAAAISLAAVPLLVIDNLPATAETNEVAVQATAGEQRPSSSSAIATSETTAAPTTTSTEAPTTTAAPETTAAPASTETSAVEPLAAPAPTAPPTTAAPATTAPPPPPPSEPGDPDDPETWERLAACESGGRWSLNSGNGYYGGLQFSLASWRDVGGSGYPHEASKAEQIKRGKILQARYGWGQWPYCADQLGYR